MFDSPQTDDALAVTPVAPSKVPNGTLSSLPASTAPHNFVWDNPGPWVQVACTPVKPFGIECKVL